MNSPLKVYMKNPRKGYDAAGLYDGNGITVLSGSRVSALVYASACEYNNSVVELRKQSTDKDRYLTRNLYFKTPSGAAMFVCGRSANGNKEWFTADGSTLKTYLESIAGQQIAMPTDPSTNASSDSAYASQPQPEPRHSNPIPDAKEIQPSVTKPAALPQQPSASIDRDTAKDGEIKRLSEQLATLQKVVDQLTSVKPEAPDLQFAEAPKDSRYRIAAAYTDAPILHCDLLGEPIHSLNVVVPFTAFGKSEKEIVYNLFFIDERQQIVSSQAKLRISSGREAKCRLTLHSGISKQKRVWLAIQDQRDVQDELQMLIPFDLQLLFDADFGF